MPDYAVYEASTGLVIRSGSTPQSLDTVQIDDGQVIIEVPAIVPINETAVVDGGLVPIPKKPDLNHVWNGSAWVDSRPQSVREEQEWERIRALRNYKLKETDWVALSDSPVSDPLKSAWLAYRAALRDLPGSTADPFAIVWPTPPSSS